MARTKNWHQAPKPRWVAQRYRDHTDHPAIFMSNRPTNPDVGDLAPLPKFAIQVYSTVPLNLDSEDELISLCRYLTSEIHDYPYLSLEIYGVQPDVFACVEHQRREIFHRKNTHPGEDFFPGIAKVAHDRYNSILQGFLLVVTSYKFRNKGGPDDYEAESGPLWVNFNRSFPLRAKVDLPSRVESFWPHGSHISRMGNECQVYSEREEIVVYKCRHMYHHLRDISDLVDGSHSETMGLEFDYGLNEDEGDPFLSNQPLELDIIESLQKKADSLTHKEFSIQSPSEDAVTITSNPTSMALEPDLQYIIHIAFPHKQHGIELMLIAQAFTAVVVDNLPQGKTISFEFFSADQPLPVILASHRNLINSRPDFAIGALHQGSRNFPQARHHHDVEVPSHREPYRIFFVILDRPDFLTGPGVLFFLADGNEMTDEAQKVYIDAGLSGYQRGGYALYQVWRSAGMTEVAQRLAMISKCTHLADLPMYASS